MKKLISFFEIPAADFNRAVSFYESVLAVSLSVMECETEKMAFFSSEEGETVGAISQAEDFRPSADGVLLHLNVEDMDQTLRRIVANGGAVIRAKTAINCDQMGFFALFKDSEGNKVGLHSDK
ncbi:MAG: VOC family protein [Bacteroides sp.]|nr:VOC family protein [Bacteroides sp.]